MGGGSDKKQSKECAICLDTLSDGVVQTLPCNHVYHTACVEQMRKFGIEQACPQCRAELPSVAAADEKNEAAAEAKRLFERGAQRVVALTRRMRIKHTEPWQPRTVRDCKERDEVIKAWKAAAELGHGMAFAVIGESYEKGLGLAADQSKALE